MVASASGITKVYPAGRRYCFSRADLFNLPFRLSTDLPGPNGTSEEEELVDALSEDELLAELSDEELNEPVPEGTPTTTRPLIKARRLGNCGCRPSAWGLVSPLGTGWGVSRPSALLLAVSRTTDLHFISWPMKLRSPQCMVDTVHPNLKGSSKSAAVPSASDSEKHGHKTWKSLGRGRGGREALLQCQMKDSLM
ncbi:hypothetical protein Cgig2_016917 [Carnegiea gigantea]|uniref:Uncharacterized protein n=1 Tax=Carnegiea gigantea TaxID=171969 RepID=A0A9Q1GR85_9CARY|nr:hypothetical protein Cgig2_016917 [Carnegiea gigantea]